jgi:hypothetical protein
VTAVRRLLAAAGLSLGLAAGVAWAASLNGTEGPDRIRGTAARDVIDGRGGADSIESRGGDDVIRAGGGRDRVHAGPGADRIAVALDGARDEVRCGLGADLVNAELNDVLANDCELVARQLARDPFSTFTGQHETQVEPDSFSNGASIVAAFQSGRYVDGGAAGIGWARSTNGGKTWRSGFLPGITPATSPAGSYGAVTDPVVGYDARRRTWLIGTLAIGEDDHATLLVSSSRDGLAWSGPRAIHSPEEEPDKEWLVCDNTATSPFYGHCYLAYMDFAAAELRVRTSRDGGRTWAAPVTLQPGVGARAIVNGAQPVVGARGLLVVVVSAFGTLDGRDNRIVAIRSTDGGATFETPATVALLHEHPVLGVRVNPLTSVEADRAGRIYAVWSDCGARYDCQGNDVVLSTSRDGRSWSAVEPVPTGPIDPAVDFVAPAVAAAPTSGAVSVLFYALRPPTECIGACRSSLDVALVTSRDGGRTWAAPRQLNAETMRLGWLADSSLGRFVGDYVSVSFAGGAPVAVFSLAGAPAGVEFRQAVFAARVPLRAVRR